MTEIDLPALAVFVKNLDPGTYKTRIARERGIDVARDVYVELLKLTEKVVAGYRGEVYVFFNNYLPQPDQFPFLTQYSKRLQRGSDLGEKMSGAIEELCETHKGVILIGSDCPLLSSAHLNKARKALQANDLVLGPADDGGYYLIGMNKHQPQLFRNIEWSTSSVLEKTMEKASGANFRVHLLEELYDVDHYEDWERYMEEGDK
ncbi:MAG: glycosyltransferase [Saprospirales bacterium]|nr:MAG: glycosyltransferase [Saprospirales bacterium]